ncbi:MAG: Holliday junction resolvase RuvX [Parcubacteria group bacterium]|nr:Holliday junction resolvase RuvX [Parcubacteria group bacterium]
MILGIDYGTKKIGLALGDEETKIATPWRVIENKSRVVVLEELVRAITDYNITCIVVGEPLSSSSERTPQTEITEKFITFLRKNLPIPVVTENEFFTTKEAKTMVRETGQKKHTVDAHAAAIILQAYLDK